MEAAEMRDMSMEDILAELDDTREALMRLRFQLTTGELSDHNQIRFTRRKIARLQTIITERAAAEDKEGEA